MSISRLIDGVLVEISDEEHLAECLAGLVAAGVSDPCPDCFTPRIDGACKPCSIERVLNADPDYRAWAEADDRLEFGAWGPDSDRPYTHDDAQADKALVARLSAKFARAERDAKTEPGGCALCGVPQRSHGQRWHGPQLRQQSPGQPRGYVAPSITLRKARMYARRAARLGLPAWTRPGAPVGSQP